MKSRRRKFQNLVVLFAVAALGWSAELAVAQRRLTQDDISRVTAAAEKLRTDSRLPEAIKEFQRALDITRQVYGPNHWQVSAYSMNLAMAYTDDEQYDMAEPILRAALPVLIREYRRGEVGNTILASHYAKAAYYNGRVGQYGRAAVLSEYALKLYLERVPDRDITAGAHVNYAQFLRQHEKLDVALTQVQLAIDHRNRYLAPTPQDYDGYWSARATKADILYDLKRYAEAEELYRSSVDYCRKKWGYAANQELELLAKGTTPLGKFAEAEELWNESIRRTQAKFGNEFDIIASRAQTLAVVQAYQGKWHVALDQTHRALQSRRAHFLKIAAGIAENEQLTYLREFTGPRLSDGLSIAIVRKQDQTVVNRSAEWVLNIKNLLFDVGAERTLLSRDARDPDLTQVSNQLKQTRRDLAQHFDASPSEEGLEKYRQRLSELRTQEDALSRELARLGGHKRISSEWLTLAQVRAAIPTGEVLIEIFKADVRDFTDRGGPQGLKKELHYLAWVIPPTGAGEVKMLDLGLAGEIDRLSRGLVTHMEATGPVAIARKEFNNGLSDLDAESPGADDRKLRVQALSRMLVERETAAEKEFRTQSDALSKLILHPLLPHLGKSTRWIVSPDNELWLIPWSALVQPDGSYVIERISQRQVISGRDLLSPSPPLSMNPALVVSAPNYQLGVTDRNRRPTQPATPLTDFKTMLGSADNPKSILTRLQAWAGGPPQVFTDDEGTEERVKGADSPRVLLLGTHGVFEGLDPNTLRPDSGLVIVNPLVRCRLVFAGCDRIPTVGEAQDDGHLFGVEVLGCNLQGTELVVLAACQSAQGDVHAGQAAVGLRSAFLLAGARSVQGTLWSVDVAGTAIFSDDFFSRLSQDRPAAEALAEAQKALRTKLTDAYGCCHPFYWSPYTLTMRGR